MSVFKLELEITADGMDDEGGYEWLIELLNSGSESTNISYKILECHEL